MTERIYKTPLGFSRYLVSHDGQSVIDVKKHKERKFQYNRGNGYVELSLSTDDKCTRVGIHRLVALAHLEVPENYQTLTVNHKDGNKHNNHKTNVEWATYRENQEHAGRLGLTEKCTPVVAIDTTTGLISLFPSILRCSEAFGVSKDILNRRVKSNGVDPVGSHVFVRKADLADFLRVFNKDRSQIVAKQKNKPIWIKDLQTQEEMGFRSHGELAEFFGVADATVSSWVKSGEQVVVKNHYLLKQSQYEPWREFNSSLDIVRIGRGRPFVLINDQTGECKRYSSAISYCKESGLKATCVNYRLATKGSQVFSDGNRYIYQDDLERSAYRQETGK